MRIVAAGSVGSRLQRTLSVGLAALLALALFAVATPPVGQAADGVVDTATTTYELAPEQGLLRVTIDLSVTNHVPSTSRMVPCTKWAYDPWYGYYQVQSTCRQTTEYYVNSTYLWLERSARHVRMTANRGSVSRKLEKANENFSGYKLSFQAIFLGQTRKIHLTYDVPGGKPRSSSTTRVGRAYVDFCAFANGLDSGSVRVVVPKAFEVSVWPQAMTTSSSGGRVVYESGPIADTSAFYRCFEGTNEAGFARSEVTSPSGRTVVVEGWPEDQAWRTAVGGEAGSDVAALEKLVGRGLPGSGPITIREVSNSELGDYAGTFDPATGVARISETYTEPGVVAHELSHAWFNLGSLATRWMSEGLAQWAERVSPTAGPPCTAPSAYPGTGSPDLDVWTILGPKSTDAQRALVSYDYDASCWIATSLATKMGEQRMAGVVAALLDRRAAYGASPTDRRPGAGPVDWKTYLDIVDEIGLVPAGVQDLEFAQDLLLEYGVADRAALAGRTEARSAYHALAADLGPWRMPLAIRTPLESWDFSEAQARTATAEEVLAQVHAADAALAGIDAVDGPAKTAFEAAADAGDLAAARAVAASQTEAAKDVAGALATMAEPRDTIEEIGLLGVDLQPVADEAVAAAKVADASAASQAAGSIRDQLARAPGVGMQRIAIGSGGAVVLLLVVAGGLVLVRRRHQRQPGLALATSLPAADAAVSSDREPGEAGLQPMAPSPATVESPEEHPAAHVEVGPPDGDLT